MKNYSGPGGRPDRRLTRILGAARISVVILLLAGCGPAGPALLPEDPPFKPGASPAQAGQEAASHELTDRGRRALSFGHIEEAITLFEQSISLYPKNPYAYFYLARAHFKAGDYRKTIVPLDQAMRYLPEDRGWLTRMYLLKGESHEALGEMEGSEEAFRAALEVDRNNTEAREGLARLQTRPSPASPSPPSGSQDRVP